MSLEWNVSSRDNPWAIESYLQKKTTPYECKELIAPRLLTMTSSFKKKKVELHYFSKLNCKDLVKKVFSFLNEKELFESVFELPNRNLSNIVISHFNNRLSNSAYFKGSKSYFTLNSLSVNQCEKTLDLFFNNFHLSDFSLPQNTKYFIIDSKTDTLYALSYRTISIKHKNKASTYITLQDYMTHFQLLFEYNKKLIALFTLDTILFLNLKTKKIVRDIKFSSEYLEYNPVHQLFIAFSDVNGSICIINPHNKMTITYSIFDISISGFSLNEISSSLMCFYSTNPKESKHCIKLFDILKVEEVDTPELTNGTNSPFTHACYYGGYIIGVDSNYIFHWEVKSFQLVSKFSLESLGKEVFEGIQYVKEINERVFVVFYEKGNDFKGKIIILQKNTGKFLSLDMNNMPKVNELKKRAFYHMIKKRKNQEMHLQFYSSEVPIGKSTKIERDDYVITYL